MHLERLINLLEIIAVIGRPVSATEVQAASGLPKPTCYRLVQTLHEQGLIEEPNGDGRYVIGERLIRIALLGKSDVDMCRVAAPLLKEAAATFNETVFLARFRDSKIEIIHVETPEDPARAFIHTGIGERPLHACSCSKAIAAVAESEFQENILRGSLQAYTDHTKTTRADLLAEFDVICHQGLADCDQ
jgi:IclR family acetate operon transcriptional repressor